MTYDNLISELKIHKSKPVIIAIDGVAGAGKTTLANKISADLDGTQIVHMDDLYSGWVEPFTQELSSRILNQILEPFSKSKLSKYNKYDWELKSFNGHRYILPTKYLILEGVGAAQQTFHKYLDIIIWIDFDAHEGFQRVLNRDGEHFRNEMLKFLNDQALLFEKEKTNYFANYIFQGVP